MIGNERMASHKTVSILTSSLNIVKSNYYSLYYIKIDFDIFQLPTSPTGGRSGEFNFRMLGFVVYLV